MFMSTLEPVEKRPAVRGGSASPRIAISYLPFKIAAMIRPKGPRIAPQSAFATIDEEPDDAEDDGACDDEFHDFVSFLAAASRSRHRPILWAALI